MSGTYGNKIFLLDEAQIEEDAGMKIDDFDELVELAWGHVEAFADRWERPWVEVLAVTSERFDRCHIRFEDYRAMWSHEALGWSKVLSGLRAETEATGFKNTDDLSPAFEDVAFDLREGDGKSGRRVLVEIAHVFE